MEKKYITQKSAWASRIAQILRSLSPWSFTKQTLPSNAKALPDPICLTSGVPSFTIIPYDLAPDEISNLSQGQRLVFTVY